MKKLIISLIAIALALPTFAEGNANRAEWRFSKKPTKSSQAFLDSGIYPAAVGIKGAELSFRHKGRVTKCSLTEKGYPTALAKRGDYWLLEVPVTDIAAGTAVDIFLPFLGNKEERNSFLLEYRDGKRWLPAAEALSTTSHSHMNRLWASAVLSQPIVGSGKIAFRLKLTEKADVQSAIACPSPHGQQPQIIIYDNQVPRDTLSILFIGNSYTYYHSYPVIFKEIAWREGHYADCSLFVSGGYTMRRHLDNKYCMDVVKKGGYDWVMLQDQSILPTLNSTPDDSGSAKDMAEMVGKVHQSSPNAKVAIEITWGRRYGNNNFGKYEQYIEKYPHFYADYDAMQNRLIEVMTAEAEQIGTEINPLGLAWQIVMHERPDIVLYHTDNHHQSYAGAYLSAVVAYLKIYGEKFGSNPANCKLDAQTAAYLRAVAERVVLNGEKWSQK